MNRSAASPVAFREPCGEKTPGQGHHHPRADDRGGDNGGADIKDIEGAIARFESINYRLPDDLTAAGKDQLRDPWDSPYQYLNLAGANRGQMRKDRNLVPINSDYDLYSMGPDGKSRPPLTARHSRDDIVRANNGGFVGTAEAY